MIDSLHIYYEGQFVGHLNYDRLRDRIEWVYDDEWYNDPDSFPSSLSLEERVNPDEPIRHFIWGLLPDNSQILESWGKRFHVSARNPFDLLKHVGEDCAGALQFIQPDRVDDILCGKSDQLIPLTKRQVQQRLDDLTKQTANHPSQHEGRFSLAGAQRKDALHLVKRKWHLPEGRIPTTHILKPQIDFDHHALNEHFCLNLAKQSGLPVPTTQVIPFGDLQVIVVKRYDRRLTSDGHYLRIHQEDFCQALNIHPSRKYQNEGGPSIPDIITLLRKHSIDAQIDIDNFLRALALNWVLLGTDAHAKNYSLLIASQSSFRLAPFYDIASFLPYVKKSESQKVKFAMKYGHEYLDCKIDQKQWRHLATDSKLKPDYVLSLITDYLNQIETLLPDVHSLVSKKHRDPFLDKLCGLIKKRLKHCHLALRKTF